MGCGCGKRAKKVLEVAERHSVPMPRIVRRHLERTAAKDDGKPPRTSVRQGSD